MAFRIRTRKSVEVVIGPNQRDGVHNRYAAGTFVRDKYPGQDVTGMIKSARSSLDMDGKKKRRGQIVRELSRLEIETAALEVRKDDLVKKLNKVRRWLVNRVIIESLEYDLNESVAKAARIEETVRQKFRSTARLGDLDQLVLTGNTKEIIRRAHNYGGASVVVAAMAKVSLHREKIGEEKQREMTAELGSASEKLSRSKDKRHRSLAKRIEARDDRKEVLTYIERLKSAIAVVRRDILIANDMIEEEVRNLDTKFDVVSKAAMIGTIVYLLRTAESHKEVVRNMAAASISTRLEKEIASIDGRCDEIRRRETELLALARQE